MKTEIAYSIIKRAVSDPSYLQDIINNADDVFQNEQLKDPVLVEELKYLAGKLADLAKNQPTTNMVEEWNDYYKKQLTSNVETLDAFKSGLRDTIKQIENGFKSTSLMYKVAFYLGVSLVVLSVVFAVFSNGSNDKSILSIAFGSLGVADIIAFFITKPPQQLQSSRADLAQLELAYYNWFVDNYNWNWYINSLYDWGDPDRIRERMKEASTILLCNTDKTMNMIEKYCEFTKKEESKDEKSRSPNTSAT